MGHYDPSGESPEKGSGREKEEDSLNGKVRHEERKRKSDAAKGDAKKNQPNVASYGPPVRWQLPRTPLQPPLQSGYYHPKQPPPPPTQPQLPFRQSFPRPAQQPEPPRTQPPPPESYGKSEDSDPDE